ncbi:MAG TPA: class I SAM-dependent methyltransferase [Opitutaceae bacterium]|nr:class I SAM-dependent methyltransferase [Opitutaceae bacterium]
MDSDPAKFESKVKTEWIDDATAAAWKKWHAKSLHFWRELNEGLFSVARLAPGQRVLDLASGTGDPAIAIAKQVGPTGHVIISDLAPQMLAISREHAADAKITNASFAIVDAHALPQEDASLDRVTCRLGVMFFWDCQRALREIRRVLKPGGVAAFVAWGPVEENEYMRAALEPFKRRRPPPPAPPGAPTPYRFAAPGSLGAELRAAGFSTVTEETRPIRQAWPGPPAELWTRLYEVSAPMRPYFNSFDPAIRAEAAAEAVANFSKYYDGREVSTRATIVVAGAVK